MAVASNSFKVCINYDYFASGVSAWDDNKHSVNMLTQKLAYSYDDGNGAFTLTAYQLWVIITHTGTPAHWRDKPGVVDFIGVHVFFLKF